MVNSIKFLSSCLIIASLFVGACGSQTGEAPLSTDVIAQGENPSTVAATPAESEPKVTAESQPVEEIALAPREETPAEWSVEDRALAFHPELQALQETYDHAIHHMAVGDLLAAQDSLDAADLALGELIGDSTRMDGGLATLFLSSLQIRLDHMQEILDEETMMRFAAPLGVANDSLVALWYGGLPDVPARPLELVINERVQKWLDYFTGRGHKNFQVWLERGEAFRPFIESALARYELPNELYYLAMIESGFVAKAKSSAGAVGPWQFIRGTGRRYGLTIDYWIDERRDIVRSTEAACQYLLHLYGMFQDWNLAMAGYNSGEYRVQSSARRAGSRNFWDLKLPRQTRDYVPKMMAATLIGLDPVKYGFQIPSNKPFTYEELSVDEAVDLSLIAKKGRFKRSALEKLNPHLLRWCTPPDHKGYAVHVPAGKAASLKLALAQLSRDERVSFAKHKVRRGETLYEIARGYGTTIKAIMRRNNISNPRSLRAGKTILIPTHPDNTYREPAPNGVIAAAEKVLPPLSVPDGYAKGFYTVGKGENLSLISQRLGVRVKRLQNWNGLGRSTRIYPNQVLQYLYTASGASAPALASVNADSRRVHIVRKGESLYSIAKRYGTSIKAILGWNNTLGEKSLIHPGDKLVLFVSG